MVDRQAFSDAIRELMEGKKEKIERKPFKPWYPPTLEEMGAKKKFYRNGKEINSDNK